MFVLEVGVGLELELKFEAAPSFFYLRIGFYYTRAFDLGHFRWCLNDVTRGVSTVAQLGGRANPLNP